MAKNPCKARYEAGDVSLSSLNADGSDFAFLSAARFFCTSFSESDPSAWLTAILASDSIFPGGKSAEKMRRSLSIVHEMLTSRKSMFRFSNPRCQVCSAIVTKDERYLLQMVQFARQGATSRLTSSAMLLCEGNAIDRVVAAALDLAELVGDVRLKENA